MGSDASRDAVRPFEFNGSLPAEKGQTPFFSILLVFPLFPGTLLLVGNYQVG